MRNIKNPTDNTGYMPLKLHIALTVVLHYDQPLNNDKNL
tara:strand:- start:9214 stop:9330 length:117 start_codon:yes stop_codon:yes gene_type:complete